MVAGDRAGSKKDSNIPLTQETLTELPGIGRKSANVIRREAGVAPKADRGPACGACSAEAGHCFRNRPKKIEKQIMWETLRKRLGCRNGDVISWKRICRPTNPKCEICVMRPVCEYYKTTIAPSE